MACHKTIFLIKMSCTKSGKWPLLNYSSFLCVLHFNVVFLLSRSSLIFDVFPSVLVCYPDLFFSRSIYEFRPAVYYCCLYLEAKTNMCLSCYRSLYHGSSYAKLDVCAFCGKNDGINKLGKVQT